METKEAPISPPAAAPACTCCRGRRPLEGSGKMSLAAAGRHGGCSSGVQDSFQQR